MRTESTAPRCVSCSAFCTPSPDWQGATLTAERRMQVLKQGVPDILTLDLKRISSKGVISGSNFRVPPLADATIRFGSPAPQQVKCTGVGRCLGCRSPYKA